MIPVVDNNGQEELTSVYVTVHYAILYQRLAECQGIRQRTLFYFQTFFNDVSDVMIKNYLFW
jgi:hypothetical protein